MPGTRPLQHPLDGPPPTQAPADPIAAFHHPAYAGVILDGNTVKEFLFNPPLTGHEDRPSRPVDSYGLGLSAKDSRYLDAEYEAALVQWSQARLRRAVRIELGAAKAAWSGLTSARTAMNTAFDALRSAPDNQWRAQTLRLLDLHAAALTASEAWDQIAGRLAKAQEYHTYDVTWVADQRTVRGVACELGASADDWEIDEYGDYFDRWGPRTPSPMVAAVTAVVDHHRQVLQEISALVGPLADGTSFAERSAG